MKRFVKEYANYRLADCPFYFGSFSRPYANRIKSAVRNCERGYITENEAIEMILHAEEYARAEAKGETE